MMKSVNIGVIQLSWNNEWHAEVKELTEDLADESVVEELVGELLHELGDLLGQLEGPVEAAPALDEGAEALDEALAAVVVEQDGDEAAGETRVLAQLLLACERRRLKSNP